MAVKLLQIREALGLTQGEMAKWLRYDTTSRQVSLYERDKSEPPLEVLLMYSKLAKVTLNKIVDDRITLRLEKKTVKKC
jgi:Predicted transcriptional regulators